MTDFNSPQYKRVMKACKERDQFPTQAWIPDEPEEEKELTKDDAFNTIVEGMKILGWDKKECVHTQLHEAQDVKVNFGVLEQHTDAMKQQSELIERWVEQEEKRLPPKPPMSPYE